MLGTRVTWHFFYLFFLVGSPQLNAHIFAIKHKLLQPPKYILNGPQIPGKITTEQTRYINPESGLLLHPEQSRHPDERQFAAASGHPPLSGMSIYSLQAESENNSNFFIYGRQPR